MVVPPRALPPAGCCAACFHARPLLGAAARAGPGLWGRGGSSPARKESPRAPRNRPGRQSAASTLLCPRPLGRPASHPGAEALATALLRADGGRRLHRLERLRAGRAARPSSLIGQPSAGAAGGGAGAATAEGRGGGGGGGGGGAAASGRDSESLVPGLRAPFARWARFRLQIVASYTAISRCWTRELARSPTVLPADTSHHLATAELAAGSEAHLKAVRALHCYLGAPTGPHQSGRVQYHLLSDWSPSSARLLSLGPTAKRYRLGGIIGSCLPFARLVLMVKPPSTLIGAEVVTMLSAGEAFHRGCLHINKALPSFIEEIKAIRLGL
eukprot:scaffold3826_cov407-Prasinococcus_capsulatus_cf.AAC.7